MALTVLLAAALPCFLPAQSITGTVTNKTTNRPAAGDDVVLVRLQQGMQEAARTKTDARGHFTLEAPDPGFHLLRVTHDKANYFRPAPPGTQSIDMDVYNAAAKVPGVTAEAEVIRLQTDESGKALRVVENFFIKNESNPPRTQFSDRPFEFYLPAGAVVEGSAALAPGGMPVQSPPVPLEGANHFAFVFPIRPGETRFQISYKVPYSGSFQFVPKPAIPTDTVAVMMPKSMTFQGGPGSPFSPITDEVNAQTFVARNVTPSQQLGFTVSGTGQMPRDAAAAPEGAQGAAGGPGADGSGQTAAPATAATDTRPGGGLGTPIDPGGNNDPWAKYKWWILGGLGLVLAAGAGLMLKGGGALQSAGVAPVATSRAGTSASSPGGSNGLLQALKEELFVLETDRLQGRLNDAAYAKQKSALEIVLRRALDRNGATASGGSPGTSNPAGPF